MKENALRTAVCSQAKCWLGCKEADNSHREIIDLYNRYRKPGDYKMTYADPWCAAFVSAVGMAVSVANRLPGKPCELIPSSAACDLMITQYKAAGRWVENDDYLPTPGDVIFYDWQDSGAGDNTGSSDHVGIVVSVAGSTITVIEGNKSDSVSYRTVRRGEQYIRGYGIPDYAGAAAKAQQEREAVIIVDEQGESGLSHSEDIRKNGTNALPVLRRGDGVGNPSDIVRAAQLLLIGRGFRCGPWGADGEFGSATYGAAYQFQRARGLEVDGVIGPKTWAALLGL